MIPETFAPAPRVVVICRSKIAARQIIAGQTIVPADHPCIRYACETRDLLGCTDAMALLDLSHVRLTPKAERSAVQLPYGRIGGGERFDHRAKHALRTLTEARRLGLQTIELADLVSRMKD